MMRPDRRLFSTVLIAGSVFIASCAADSPTVEESAPEIIAATETTTTLPPSTTTTTLDVVAEYCAASRAGSEAMVRVELQNGLGSHTSRKSSVVALEQMERLDVVPDELAREVATVTEAMSEALAAHEPAGGELSYEQLVEIWTVERQASAEVLVDYDSDVCGFTQEDVEDELGLTEMIRSEAVAGFAVMNEFDVACTDEQFADIHPDELARVGIGWESLDPNHYPLIIQNSELPTFDAFLLTVSHCTSYYEQTVRDIEGVDTAEEVACVIDNTKDNVGIVAALMLGTTDGASFEDVYPAPVVDLVFDGLFEFYALMDEVAAGSCPGAAG